MKKTIKIRIAADDLLFYLLFLFAWILFALNRGSADYNAYKLIYNTLLSSGKLIDDLEIGYVLLMRGAIAMRLPFEIFFGAIASVGLVLIADSISKYSLYRGKAMLFYCITCLLMDIVQVRNFLGMAIVLFAFRYIQEKKKLYIILLALAISISAMTVVFLPAILLIEKKVEYKRYMKGLTIVFLIILVGSTSVIQFVSRYYLVAGRYIDPIYKTYKSFFIYLMFYIICEFLIVKIAKMYNIYNKVLQNIAYRLSLYTMMFMPLLLINLVYERIYRIGLLLLFIALESVPKKKSAQKLITIAAFIIAVVNAYLFYGFGTGRTHVLEMIFQNNYFFDLFK